MNEKNLRPRKTLTKEEAKKMGSMGGKASVEARRKKKLMSQIYAEFLAERFKVKIGGSVQNMTGEKLVDSVIKKILASGGPGAVSLMKEIREATEGSKVALTDIDGGPFGVGLLTHEETLARLAELRTRQNA